MKYLNSGVQTILIFAVCSLLGGCLNSPADSITDDSATNKISIDTTAAQIAVAPNDSLQIAVSDVVKDFEGVQAKVVHGEIALSGVIEGPKMAELMTRLNSLRPTRIVNRITVLK